MGTLISPTEQQTSIYPYIDHLVEYQDIQRIGGGTYGNVYKARCTKTDKYVALKHILIQNEEEGFPISALNEITILQSLIHENIVQFIDMCRSPKKNSFRSDFYLVLEFCDHDLAGILKNITTEFTLKHIKSIMKQILDGLYFLHNNKIIHRDLKPANILITKDGILKIADFGLSKVIKSSEYHQQNGHTIKVVTLWYRAPELLLGDQSYGLAIDMWSVGCIFAELWTRNPIMRGNDEEHQLGLICKLCGSIEWSGVHNLPSYHLLESSQNIDLQVENCLINYKEKIQVRLAVDLIDKLLTLDPKERINVDEAVKSSFFKPDPSSEDLKSLLSNWSSMFESNVAPHNAHHQRNAQQQRRNWPKGTFEPTY